MPERGRVLVTGGTGYLGAEIVHRLLDRGYSCLLLVRPEALSRAKALFEGVRSTGGFELLQGDITLPDVGVSSLVLSRLRGVDTVIHLAALARFSGYAEETMRRVNVEGTRNVFDLGERLGAKAFFHFSTAYVAGLCPTVFREEDLDKRQEFRNDYERSKFEAERLLAGREIRSEMAVTILRPSLVVGDGSAGVGQGRGLFGIFDILQWYQAQLERLGPGEAPDLLIPGRSDLRANLISLQAVVALFIRILETPDLWGGAYHLVNRDYLRMGRVKSSLERLMRIPGIRLSEGASLNGAAARSDRLSRLFRRKLGPYFPYFETAPRWSRDRLEAAIPDWEELCSDALKGTFLDNASSDAEPSEDSRWVNRYFEEFIPSRVDDPAFNEIRRLDELVGISVEGTEPSGRLIRFRHRELQVLDADADAHPRCVFRLDLATFAEIVAGEIPPQEAFFSRRVRISGEVFFGLKLGSLLEGFFQRHPYRTPRASER